MPTTKKSKAITDELNAKKAKKELEALIKFSSDNAEQAYALMDKMRYEGKSLYDVVFDGNQGVEEFGDSFGDMSENEKDEFSTLTTKMTQMAKTGEDVTEISLEIATKFPQIMKSGMARKGNDFLIDKILKLGGKDTKELASLYDSKGIKDLNFMEVVEKAKLYIMFLGNV